MGSAPEVLKGQTVEALEGCQVIRVAALPTPGRRVGGGAPSPSTIRAQSRLRPLMQMSLFVEKVLRCSRICSNSPAFCSFSEADSVGGPQN